MKKTCRSCGRTIEMLKTDYGRWIPCDPGIGGVWEDPNAPDRVVTESGRVIRGRLQGDPAGLTDIGQVAHRCGRGRSA